MKFSSSLLSGAAMYLSATNALGKFSIDPEHRVIRDSFDRHVIFHGVNVVYKVDPYLPEEDKWDSQLSLSDEDIKNLTGWGFNFVRLGVMWEAVETAPGVYNEKYLDSINELVTRLGQAGIYTLIDAHQDANARMNCGEGWPNFHAFDIVNKGTFCVGNYSDTVMKPLMKKFGGCMSPLKDYGYRIDKKTHLPMIEDCLKQSFFYYYTSPESFTLFRALYKNHFGFQDKYIAF